MADEALLTDEAWSFVGALPQATVRALLRLFARSSVATIVFDTLFVPDSGHSAVVEGGVQGRDDLRYKWDKPASRLFFRAFIGGRWVTLTDGTINPLDQVFYDANGKPIARIVGDAGLIASLSVLDSDRERLESESDPVAGEAGAPASPGASPDRRNGLKLCPDPIQEDNTGWSRNSLAYQQYVSGLPRGLAISVHDVRFDGCDPATGDLNDAKGRYGFMLNPDGSWKSWAEGARQSLIDQMIRQADAAALDGRNVVWHVQDARVAAALQELRKETKRTNLTVIYDPGP